MFNGMRKEHVVDDDLLDAARKVLFAVVGCRNQEFPQLQQLAAFLRYYIAADAMVAGRKLPFPDAELAARFTGAAAPSTMRHSGLRPFYFRVAYEEAVMQYGIEHAQPDLDILHRFVPESWVRVIANMIAEGPSVAAARAQVALYRYSKGNVRANRRRSTQQRSQAAVSIVLHQAQGLFKTICSLQSLASCQHWAHIRKLMLPEMEKGGYDTVAPRAETIRRVLNEMTDELQARLGVSSIEDELKAIESMSKHKLLRTGSWRVARDRALLVLMVLTGGRRTALARLTRADYIRDHEGPFPDYRKGGALDLRPRKGKGREEVRRKPVPPEAALVLDAYIALMDRTIAASGCQAATTESPLLVSEPSHSTKRVRELWLYRRVAGAPRTRALVPRDPDHMADHVSPEQHPYCGYTPHEYRHFANKLAERAGEIWNMRHPAVGGEAAKPISYYAAALLDNGGIETDLRRRYADADTPAMLEVLAGRAAEVGWEVLTTDVGLRKRADLVAFKRELARLGQIKADERRLLERSRKLSARYSRCKPRALLSCRVPGQDRIDLMLSYQEELLRSHEDQLVSIDELKEMFLEGTRITHQMMELSEQKAETTAKANRYRYDQKTWQPLSDSEPSGAEDVDLDAIETAELGRALIANDEPIAVRDWVTVPEFCQIAGIETRSRATRWIRGEHIPSRRDKRPWEPDEVPIDTSLGPHYRRIWIPGVHDAFWRTDPMRTVLAKTLSCWPIESGWATKDGQPTWRCKAPLRISPARLHIVDTAADDDLQAA
jgi:integrase